MIGRVNQMSVMDIEIGEAVESWARDYVDDLTLEDVEDLLEDVEGLIVEMQMDISAQVIEYCDSQLIWTADIIEKWGEMGYALPSEDWGGDTGEDLARGAILEDVVTTDLTEFSSDVKDALEARREELIES